jgi:hypothetical protein
MAEGLVAFFSRHPISTRKGDKVEVNMALV